jgi:hypothetical protein
MAQFGGRVAFLSPHFCVKAPDIHADQENFVC